MNININTTMISHIGQNFVQTGLYFASGYAVAMVVDQIGRSLLNPTRGSTLEKAVKFFAFTAGLAVTSYYASKLPVIAFKADQALNFFVLEAGASVALYLFTGRFMPIVTIGALTGLLGAPALAAFGAVGALLGSGSKLDFVPLPKLTY